MDMAEKWHLQLSQATACSPCAEKEPMLWIIKTERPTKRWGAPYNLRLKLCYQLIVNQSHRRMTTFASKALNRGIFTFNVILMLDCS